VDVEAGRSLEERTELLARLGQVYLTVEGGPRVAREALAAFQCGAVVLPLASTGGASSGMFGFPAEALSMPSFATPQQWDRLQRKGSPESTSRAVVEIISGLMAGGRFGTEAAAGWMRVEVTIVGVTNLSDDENVYCVFSVRGNPDFRFQTHAVDRNQGHEWNQDVSVDALIDGDQLDFNIFSRNDDMDDDLLGKACLTSEQCFPKGFHGVLPLSESGHRRDSAVVVNVDVLTKSKNDAASSKNKVQPEKEVVNSKQRVKHIAFGHELSAEVWTPASQRVGRVCFRWHLSDYADRSDHDELAPLSREKMLQLLTAVRFSHLQHEELLTASKERLLIEAGAQELVFDALSLKLGKYEHGPGDTGAARIGPRASMQVQHNSRPRRMAARESLGGGRMGTPSAPIHFHYNTIGPSDDCGGALYWLGSRGQTSLWRNPVGLGFVQPLASSVGFGKLEDIAGRAAVNLRTENVVNSYFGVDFLGSRLLICSGYSLRSRDSSSHIPLSWEFQGSRDAKEWETIDKRGSDCSLWTEPGQTAYFPVEPPKAKVGSLWPDRTHCSKVTPSMSQAQIAPTVSQTDARQGSGTDWMVELPCPQSPDFLTFGDEETMEINMRTISPNNSMMRTAATGHVASRTAPPGAPAFRAFRLLQIGKNSSHSDNLALSGMEVYGWAVRGAWP